MAGGSKSPADAAKRRAAEAALAHVEPGMVLGLGTGSTAAIFIRLLAEEVREGLEVTGAPTSEATARLARELGVRLVDPNDVRGFDLTIDGADEIDPQLRLIKGGGAALLREKIIADASDAMIVIADASKRVDRLGRFPLPVEVNPFACELTREMVLESLPFVGLKPVRAEWRMATPEQRLHTDGGHLILDLHCGEIPDPDALGAVLDRIPGVVEHGLFLGMADLVLIGEADGVLALGTLD